MDISYKYDLCHNFAVIKADNSLDNSYKFKMILNNSIKGLLKTSSRIIDNEIYMYYDISSKHSIEEVFENKQISYNDLKQILIAIYTCIEEVNKHLLDVKDIILDPKMIFYNLDKNIVEFCYYPQMESEFKPRFNIFLQYILTKINHEDKEAVLLAYDLQNMSLHNDFMMYDILDKLSVNNQMPEKKEEKQDYNNDDLNIIYDNQIHYKNPPYKSIIPGLVKAATCLVILTVGFIYSGYIYRKFGFIILAVLIGIIIYIIYHKTYDIISGFENEKSIKYQNNEFRKQSFEYVNDSEETMILDSIEDNDQKCLVYLGEDKSERINLKGYPFLIGKIKEKVSYSIYEPCISRMHARITKEGLEYFIEDLNSTNGTYINNERIDSYTKIRIQSGDVIKFAKLPYRFN